MKRIYTLLGVLLFASIIFAQAPAKMSFQAVVRDNNNNLIANTAVGVRISILQNTAVVYVETQTPRTNDNGLFSIEIGGGPGFELIDWTNGPYFIRSEVDPTGGKSYSISGTSQLLSVPYALHAMTAGSLTGSNALKLKGADTGVGSNAWSQFGNAKTDPLKDKLGTIDPVDMVFVTNNQERIRIKSDGPTDVSNDLTVKKNVYLNTVEGGTTNSGTLTVGGVTDLNDDLNVNNGNPTYLTGSLTVNGSTSLEGKASMGGGADFTGPVEFNGQITISATITGDEDDEDFDAYPLRVQGGKQGMAIKVNGNRTNANNFVTFWDGDKIQGRIEGENATDLATNPEYIVENLLSAGDLLVGGLDVVVNGFEFIQAIADLAAACSSVTGCAGLGAVVCSPIPSLIAAATTNLVVKTASLAVSVGNEALVVGNVAAYNTFKWTQLGVTYQSGAGDYAEWLPKADPIAIFNAGEIVGVKAGKISYNTADADKVMVVSNVPIVLGNMPPENNEGDFEKVTFMGQVPVKVKGTVNESDYILPSGDNDGFGIAVSPENMMIGDYQKIVGIAWSLRIGDYVNVAVGLNGNDVARYSQELKTKIEDQASELNELKVSFNQVVDVLKKYDQKLASSLMDIGTFTTTTGNGNGGGNERVVKYFKPNKKQFEDAITEAEDQMRAKYGDEKINKHPFFKDMKSTVPDPTKGNKTPKEAFLDEVSLAFDKEVAKQEAKNAKQGIKTEKEDIPEN